MYSFFIFNNRSCEVTFFISKSLVIKAEYLHIRKGIMLEYLFGAIIFMVTLFQVYQFFLSLDSDFLRNQGFFFDGFIRGIMATFWRLFDVVRWKLMMLFWYLHCIFTWIIPGSRNSRVFKLFVLALTILKFSAVIHSLLKNSNFINESSSYSNQSILKIPNRKWTISNNRVKKEDSSSRAGVAQ